jgi:hypothetical protein
MAAAVAWPHQARTAQPPGHCCSPYPRRPPLALVAGAARNQDPARQSPEDEAVAATSLWREMALRWLDGAARRAADPLPGAGIEGG